MNKNTSLPQVPADHIPAPVDVSVLRRTAMEEPPQVIDGLFPEGATLVYGLPKCGKSTLTIGIEMFLSIGYKMGGNLAGDAGGRVQVIDLEGNAQLIRGTTLRYAELGTLPGDSTDGPEHNQDAAYIFFAGWPGGTFAERYYHLRKHLEAERDRGRDVRMLRIDTMARFIGSPPQGQNAYEWMIECCGQLNELADRLHMAIILIHHPNKLGEISGSNGIASSVTAIYQLKRDRDTNTGLLICEGNRSAAERTWPLTYTSQGTWDFDGELNAVQVVNSGARRRVADLLTERGPMTGPHIRDALGDVNEVTVKQALRRMRAEGQARRDNEGLWRLTDPQTGEAPVAGTPVPVRVKGTCVACGEDMTVIVSGQTMHPCCEPETVTPACDIPAPGGDDVTAAAGFNAYKVMQDTLEASPLHPLWFIPVADRENGPWPAAIQASSTAQHAHKWTRPDLHGFGAGRVILPLDRHQSYPGSCNGVPVAANKVMHYGPLSANPKLSKLAGICEVMVPEWPHEDRIGHPLGRDAVPGRSLWVPSGQVEQLWKLHEQGCITRPVVVDSWLGRRTTSLFDAYQVAVRDARAAASTPEEVTAVKFHSSVAIRKLHPVEAKSQQWRPDWHAAICAEAATRLWAVAWRAVQAGAELAWMGSCDACAWIVPEDADDGWLPPGYLLGDGPGTYHHGSFRVPVTGGGATETIEGPAVLNTWLRRRG